MKINACCNEDGKNFVPKVGRDGVEIENLMFMFLVWSFFRLFSENVVVINFNCLLEILVSAHVELLLIALKY